MKNLFIINLTYTSDLDTVLKNRPDHVTFLQKYYDAGIFIASGPKVPREGGVILAQADNKDQVMKIANQDPFITRNLATYEITEFVANMAVEGFFKS